MSMTEQEKIVYRKSVDKRLREMQENPYDRAHGTPTGYAYGCRCYKCAFAESEYQHAKHMRNKGEYRKRWRKYYHDHRDEIARKRHERYIASKAEKRLCSGSSDGR